MANKMLIDATHPEETRVVVLRGNRVEEFDFESASRRQLRGNIYLAKVTRVEPSLQAAFVDYGGNRHGFLAFSEIHPDYYQIPVADRQALIAEEERAHRDAEDEIERRATAAAAASATSRMDGATPGARSRWKLAENGESAPGEAIDAEFHEVTEASADHPDTHQAEAPSRSLPPTPEPAAEAAPAAEGAATAGRRRQRAEAQGAPAQAEQPAEHDRAERARRAGERRDRGRAHRKPDLAPANGDRRQRWQRHRNRGARRRRKRRRGRGRVGRRRRRARRSAGAHAALPPPYKIQEVIKRRQIMLVQVVKEERGTKGAALTTYLSLAGRYSVLMPNTARGGGISRKITNAVDRKQLKEIAQDLEVPEGMGVILRTAGAARTKTEVEARLRVSAAAVGNGARFHAEVDRADARLRGRLADQALDPRPLQQGHRGDPGRGRGRPSRSASDFMRMLMPSHAKNVKPYKDTQPVFTRYGIESQLDAMFTPTVQLRSGGYIVINQTEALVAIDVNSGRATREHHIEDTALKTNLEAAEEIARQLRLRDLAGLIVIDFIDMDEGRNNRTVERRLKEALKNDRARIQVGRISHFGLMEMSRQRIRSSVLESSTDKCPHCGGTGHVRSVSSVALHLLRMIEEMLLKGATHNLIVRTRTEVALYVLNHKRAHLRELEEPLPDRHHGQRRRDGRRRAALPDREGRAGALGRGRQGDRWRRRCRPAPMRRKSRRRTSPRRRDRRGRSGERSRGRREGRGRRGRERDEPRRGRRRRRRGAWRTRSREELAHETAAEPAVAPRDGEAARRVGGRRV